MRETYNGILNIYTCRLESYLEKNRNKKKRLKENRKAQHSNNNRKLEAAERITLKLEKTIYKGYEDIKIKSTIIIKLHIRGINLADLKKPTSKAKPGTEETVIRVRTPRRENNEILATVESLLGANRLRLRCMDGVVRMGRIPGSMKKKTWIREGDVVIVVPWEFQNEKADVIWKYTRPQVDWLDRKGYLKG